jgi:hypothetical protein
MPTSLTSGVKRLHRLPEWILDRPRPVWALDKAGDSCLGISRSGQMRQIFVDRTEFLIIHSSNRPPRHLLAEFMTVGIDSGTHGCDKFLQLPSLYKIEIWPNRRHLTGRAAGQLFAVATAAILIRQDIFAILRSWTLWRRRNGTCKYRLSLGKQACTQHHDP